MNRQLAQAARRLADQQTARLSDIPATRSFLATVSVVSPLTVTWRGADLQATGYLASYTPTVGDRVECRLQDSQLIVVDKIVVV